MHRPDAESSRSAGFFQTTSWSVVRQALSEDRPESLEALTQICEAYWHPIYAFIRRSGYSSHDAEDLTQGFFAKLIEKRFLSVADQDKGRLRTFLLTCLKRHLSDEADRDRAAKRGRGKIVSIDSQWVEEHHAIEAVDNLTPDRLYQKRWALTLLESTFKLLEDRYKEDGKGSLFTSLRPFLSLSTGGEDNYRKAAADLGVNLNTFKSHVHRLRERWRELLMSQVADTLDDPTSDNIKAELAELIGCV